MSKRTVTHATFVIERVYPHPPAKVFRAFSEHAEKKKWFASPEGWTTTEDTMDFRVGGRDVHEGGPVGGFVSRYEGQYHDIVPNERIVTTYDMIIDGKRVSISLNTVELTAEGNGTRLTLTETGAYLDGFDNADGRKAGTEWLLDTLGTSLG